MLLGGSPPRLLTLNARAAESVRGWLNDEPVPDDPTAGRLARRLLDAGLVHPHPPAGVHSSADVTLVVPVKDNPAGTAQLLDATRDLARRIVVDDGSADPLPRATIRHDRPRGAAAARNTGWRLASTELVAFLDSDITPEPGWLEAILPQFGDPQVVAVAPRVRSQRTGWSPAERYEADFSRLDMGDGPAPVRPLSRVSYVPTAALVVRRSALADVAGFDEELRFGEDVDLVWRLLASGGTVRYEPTVTVWHTPRRTLRAWLRQRFDYGTSAAPLSHRHFGDLTCALLTRWNTVVWSLVAAGKPLPAVAVAAGDAMRLVRGLDGLPPREALGLVARRQVVVARMVAEAMRRGWWPLALLSRNGRRLLSASVALKIWDVTRARRKVDPAAQLLALADDLAYSAGVWAGCFRHRTLAPLIPRIVDEARTLR
ncbi:mycofactocin biosynthesis glycosyltransferase MftF [Saccharopolyspora erythraea]|uniref:mycofactocin biosynthesis glycosyltransferase MftF n=1 Tax=Saccharopolyspora erythraea TaxID=1836 RepID=UPI0020122D93|nr:mycofactocin biosynthesis glycosyltransferase MftF [Saccharopolyspora erythraea]